MSISNSIFIKKPADQKTNRRIHHGTIKKNCYIHNVINGIKNKASICPVIVKGTSEQIAFAWNVGVGNSTGIGFGALN